MYRSAVVLLLLQALFGTSLAVKMEKRQLSFVGRECEDQVARMNSECGTNLPNVTSGNKYEALKASCTTQACSDAVVSAFVTCSPAEGLTEEATEQAHSLLSSFYCKRHPSGDKCGDLVLDSDLMSLDSFGCGLLELPRVPDSCSPECSQLARVLAQTYGCCWTEFIAYSEELFPVGLPLGYVFMQNTFTFMDVPCYCLVTDLYPGDKLIENKANASEFWTRCGVENVGYCSSSIGSGTLQEVDIAIGPTSGQAGSMIAQKRTVLGMTLLTLSFLYFVKLLF